MQNIIDQLKQPLDVKRVKKRQGGGGTSLSYIESHDVIAHLNELFGFDAWSFDLLHFEQFATPKGIVFRQTARLTVRIGERSVTREDVGIGIASNPNSDQLEKGMKESSSDCLKRCARTLGAQFGNSLYEKDAPEHRGQQRPPITRPPSQITPAQGKSIKSLAAAFWGDNRTVELRDYLQDGFECALSQLTFDEAEGVITELTRASADGPPVIQLSELDPPEGNAVAPE